MENMSLSSTKRVKIFEIEKFIINVKDLFMT